MRRPRLGPELDPSRAADRAADPRGWRIDDAAREALAGVIADRRVVRQALSDAALVTAVQTATEAKAQALADAGVRALNHHGPATGTATDAICVAAPPGGEVAFAGPATAVGAAIAHAVHGAVLSGARIHRRTVAARGRMR